jgi:hypothetical protein
MNITTILSGAVFEISRSAPEAGAFAGWIMKNGGMAIISVVADEKISAFYNAGPALTNEEKNLVWEAFCNE